MRGRWIRRVIWAELLPLAFSRLAAARLRALLTMLGVIIGVASIVALVSVGQGATSGITNLIEGLGTNLLNISPGASSNGFLRGAAGTATTLTMTTRPRSVASTACRRWRRRPPPSRSSWPAARTPHDRAGITPEFATVRAYAIWHGSFISAAESRRGLRVAVLGSATADALGLGADADGHRHHDRRDPVPASFGILQPKGILDDQVLIPLPSPARQLRGREFARGDLRLACPP